MNGRQRIVSLIAVAVVLCSGGVSYLHACGQCYKTVYTCENYSSTGCASSTSTLYITKINSNTDCVDKEGKTCKYGSGQTQCGWGKCYSGSGCTGSTCGDWAGYVGNVSTGSSDPC
jgi:hypothetical protein